MSHNKSEIRRLPHRGIYGTRDKSSVIHEADMSHKIYYKSEIRDTRQIRTYKKGNGNLIRVPL